MKKLFIISAKDNIKYIHKLVICILLFTILSNVFALEYIYNANNIITKESSIMTVANPTFTFQSKAQVLMEPTSGTIIYANNESEKIWPASVTKIMTLLMIMEAIDNGKLQYTDIVTCSEKASRLRWVTNMVSTRRAVNN